MGDAGLILGGPILREILAAGTVIFAVFATGSQLLAGQITLSVLSDSKLCLMWYTGMTTMSLEGLAVATHLVSRNIRYPYAHLVLPPDSGPALVALYPVVHMHLGRRSSGHGGSRFLSSPRPPCGHCSLRQLLQCIRVHHEPGVCVCRPLYVFHFDIGDEEPCRREEGSVGIAGVRHLVGNQ